jgi:hypothetical protein
MVLLLLFLGGTGTAYAVPPISYQEVVVRKLVNSSGGEVLYRQGYYLGGSKGFGRDKVHNKHGITSDHVVAAVVREPQDVFQDDVANFPGRWAHRREALLVGWTGVTDRVFVRVIVDYHGWNGPGQLGVVTAYCEGYAGKCPEWVNRAF